MSNVCPLPQEFSVPVKDLNPAILAISDIHQIAVDRNGLLIGTVDRPASKTPHQRGDQE
jgi:hypothetical protein